MQALFGTRTAADINLVAQLLILAGLLVGFALARRKQFGQHANVQTAMVLLNLVLIAAVMATSFYDYVIAGETTTGPVARWMIAHAVLGVVAEVTALYLILRMRTSLIPPRFRVRNIKLLMRSTLALWAVLVVVGGVVYYERYLRESDVTTAPLLQFRQLGADLYVHAVELEDAAARGSLPTVKRHAEHLINLLEGKDGPHYGDIDADGHLEDPGDGVGLLARLDAVATAADDPAVSVQAQTLRGQLERILALSVPLIGAQDPAETAAPVAEIVEVARQANNQGVFRIDLGARQAGVVEAPPAPIATRTGTGTGTGTAAAGSVTVHEDRFLFIPEVLTVPAGTTVVWVNDEAAKHTATADDDRFDSGDQALGVSYAYTFIEPGTYPYYCRYHGDAGGLGMAGVVVVE